jgi:aminoglycoside phosphotransferase (APT) family kinase protein
MPRDHYLQPDAPDPVLADTVVLGLVRPFVPHADAVTAVDESGGEARTYQIDDAIILKTQRPHRLRPRTSLEREVVFLRHLAASPDIPVPRVLGYGREGSVEYICMTRMPGKTVQHLTLSGAARTAMLHDLGRVLARIHQIPQEPLRASGRFPADQGAGDLRARLAEAFDDVLALLARNGIAWPLDLPPEQFVARTLATLPAAPPMVALHSNPGPEHTFADPGTGVYLGTIDFGDAYISHPALDLRRWRDPADREALLAGYQAERPISAEFMQVWRMTQALADLGVIATAPAMRDTATAHLQQLWV